MFQPPHRPSRRSPRSGRGGLHGSARRCRAAVGPPVTVPALALFYTACSLVLLTACAGPPRDAAEAGSSARTYTVRAVVEQLPAADAIEPQILVRHEAIPDFVNAQGEETGMAAMTMPFPVARDLPLAEIAPGDAVELTFRVDWEGSPPLEVTAIRRLSAAEAAASDGESPPAPYG